MKELKIEKVEDGYIVNMLDYTGRKRVFTSYAKLEAFLHDYFRGEKKVEAKCGEKVQKP